MPRLSAAERAEQRRSTVSLADAAADIAPESIRPLDEPLDQQPPSASEFVQETKAGLSQLGDVKPRIGSTWAAEDVDSLTFLLTMALMFGAIRMSHSMTGTRDYAPPDETVLDAAAPMARIISRHLKVPGAAKGDIGDGMRVAAAVMGYVIFMYDIKDQRDAQQRRGAEELANGRPAQQVNAQAYAVPTMRAVASGISMRNSGGQGWTPTTND